MILITGSKGLIGTALKKQLRNLKFDVVGIDSRFPNEHPEYGDIRNSDLLRQIIPKCYGIIHLAGVTRVVQGQLNPELCWELNVNATHNLLQLVKSYTHKPWVIYASSREVYGQQSFLPVNEDADLLPINIYAKSKVAAEQLMNDYRELGLVTATLRFSNVYGSLDDYPDRVIPAFCRGAALGEELRIDGSSNTFDFTHIDDVTDGILKVIEQLQNNCIDIPKIHFTTGIGTTLRQAAEYARQASQYSVKFKEAPSRTYDVATFYGDTSRAQQILGWRAKITPQDGIAQFVKLFSEEYGHHMAKLES